MNRRCCKSQLRCCCPWLRGCHRLEAKTVCQFTSWSPLEIPHGGLCCDTECPWGFPEQVSEKEENKNFELTDDVIIPNYIALVAISNQGTFNLYDLSSNLNRVVLPVEGLVDGLVEFGPTYPQSASLRERWHFILTCFNKAFLAIRSPDWFTSTLVQRQI